MSLASAERVASTQFHEAAEALRPETREMHRAITSLMEELEAIDWYAQRIDAAADTELAAVLAHNRNEEKEHACMVLEWIRRHDAYFDQCLRRFLFTSGPIEQLEEKHEAANGAATASAERGGTLGLGSLREAEAQ
jgi:ferritin-like protein